MPALLSPRSAPNATAMMDEEPKKKKGVMGRIKSTFKLGRRKSSTSSMIAGLPPTEKDLEPEVRGKTAAQSCDDAEREEKQQEEEEEDVKPFTAEDLEEEQKEAKPMIAFASPSTPTPRSKPDTEEEDEMFASDYKAPQGPQADEVNKFEANDEEDELEVFAEDTSNQNAVPARSAPQEMDLMIIGVSPNKLRTQAPVIPSGPSASPVKRSQPPPQPQPLPSRPEEPEEDSNQRTSSFEKMRENDEELTGDRGASAHANRPSRQPTVATSPLRRSQLLSEFQFATETTMPTSPVQPSPMKRRGGGPPPLQTRRSFSREQEQQVTGSEETPIAASTSSQRKPDTPSAMPSASTRAPRPDRRQQLQGISEENAASAAPAPTKEEEELPPRPSSPRRVSREPPRPTRRRSMNTEAPILASSFVASAAPESHDDVKSSDESHGVSASAFTVDADQEEAKEASDSSASAFAFDAGAAITQEFGERVARLLGADPWGDRQDGFDAITYQIKKTDLATAKNKRELLCAAIAAVQCGVDDRVAPVMYCALECLRGVLKEYSPVLDRNFLKYAPMNEQLSALVKSIVGKLGDSNKRTQREASQALIRLTKLKKLKTLPHVLLHLSAKEVVPRLRVEMLRQLVKEVGVEAKTGLNVEMVMQFAVPALKIADEKTRKGAVELIAELYVLNAQAVNAQLVGIKPEMLRVINRRVDELMAKQEEEKQQAAGQSANQTEEALADDEPVMELIAVPSEEAKNIVAMIETQLHYAQSVIGPVAWRKLESKTWSDRKEALVDIEKSITEAKSDLRDVKPAFHSVVQQNFLAYCVIVHKWLADSIAPVVNSAMDCFSTLIKIYGPCVEWREDAMRDMILLTVMRLFGTMQKPNNRTNRAACRCILKLTRLTNPHTLRYALSCVFANETDPLVQMHLLRLLIPEFGFQPDGISSAQVLAVVATALVHSNDKVRKTAIDVALCTQRLVGKEYVLSKLKDVKAVTLKELEKNFVEDVQKDNERPQTVHATGVPSSSSGAPANALPPVQFGGSDNSRRLLNSAPVGLGKLHCTPPSEEEHENEFTGAFRRGSVLSNEEENLMDSILGGDDF
ncbi:hypothetical protein Poli38472_002190 [Pythium oligandrum]|uniref:TOG domain-containing protein n=1 Tax=Pythium oligandrum TaxID=41045 RepID=A0A8K1CGS0_PYTOL|nr:hypothetical protein Poli38472_002190 [Pythium oligandrum]|eukprot:TMW63249.1 hypothetical protein Poli38472_002190 [Pythium oligandrum]